MSEAENSDQNSSHDYGNPPKLSITIPELRDLPGKMTSWKSVKLPTDVLLVTVKDWEFLSCFPYLRKRFKSYYHGLGIVYFGHMGDVKDKVNVSLLRCSEGATGPGAALSKVKTAITILQPKAVFCVGFCGGLSYGKVKLGDVVISAKLTTYAHKKVMNDREQPRGIITPVSRDFADLIKHAADSWKAPLANPEVNRKVEVHRDGEFLSGPELVNSEWRREELLEKYPKAIAIEMEGEGVFAAAHDLKVEWVVIKGISDYADGSKSKTEAWQPFASVMAASVVANILKVPGILKDWQHHKGAVKHKETGLVLAVLAKIAGVIFRVTGFLVLMLLAIALVLVVCCSKAAIKLPKEIKLYKEIRISKGISITPHWEFTRGSPGEVNFKGRTIGYRAHGRVHYPGELWVYDATAWDVKSGISAKVTHYEESYDAIEVAVNKVIRKLKAKGLLQD